MPAVALVPSLEPTVIHPTRERGNHNEIAPPLKASDVRGWAVQTKFAALHKAGRIDDAEKAAGERWLRDWDSGVAGVVTPSSGAVRIDTSGGRCALDHQIDAIARLRAIREAIGDFNSFLLEVCLVHDWSWTRIGQDERVGGVTHKTAAVYVIKAIRELTAAYAAIDTSRKKRA